MFAKIDFTDFAVISAGILIAVIVNIKIPLTRPAAILLGVVLGYVLASIILWRRKGD